MELIVTPPAYVGEHDPNRERSFAGGTINWKLTRDAVVESPMFANGEQDFGAGLENDAKCANCGRILPTVTMHLDHIFPAAKYRRKLKEFSEKLILRNDVYPNSPSKYFSMMFNGTTIDVWKINESGTPINPLKQIKIDDPDGLEDAQKSTAWYNDLENLQFLCVSCNTQKGAKE